MQTTGASSTDMRLEATSRGAARALWGATPSMPLLLALAVALALAYGLFAQIAFWLLRPAGGAAFYPPAGLAFAVLVVTPRRTWPLWVVAIGAAALSFGLLHDRPIEGLVGSVSANMIEPLLGASLFLAAFRSEHGLRKTLISFALLPVLTAPLVAAILNNTYKLAFAPHLLEQQGFWYFARNWWVADALGVLVIGSLLLVWARPPYSFEGQVPLIAVAAVSAACAAAIMVSGVRWQNSALSLALPGLVWASCFGGLRAMTAVGAAAALAANWLALSGRVDEDVELLQLRLGVVFLTGLFLVVEITERRRSEHRALDAQRDLEISKRATELAEAERDRIIHDTHDLIGHGLSVMLLQIGAARRVLDGDVEAARRLLATSESIGRQACSDLDVALALDHGRNETDLDSGIRRLPDLVAALRDAGVSVGLQLDGELSNLATLVDRSGYRIVQEALTNVLKHAPDAHTMVSVQIRDRDVLVSVSDDGGAKRSHGSASPRDTLGTISMRERAIALGGTLKIGPNAEGGFTVTASLPRRPHAAPDERADDPGTGS